MRDFPTQAAWDHDLVITRVDSGVWMLCLFEVEDGEHSRAWYGDQYRRLTPDSPDYYMVQKDALEPEAGRLLETPFPSMQSIVQCLKPYLRPGARVNL